MATRLLPSLVAAAVATLLAGCSTEAEMRGAEPGGEPAAEQAAEASGPAGWAYVSRPDLTPPRTDVTGPAEGEDEDRLVLLGVKDQENGAPMNGPVITTADGEPVWVLPMGDTRWTYDLRVQRYRGEPVLTWWRGDTFPFGYGEGELVVMDDSYREIATVTTPGTHADFHDGTLTEAGTALLISYPVVRRDLSEVGGPEDGYVRSSVVHEVDVATGEELFSWDMIDHVPLTDSAAVIEEGSSEAGTEEAPWDPFHVNSVTEDGSDALIVSARNTSAVYRIDRRDGEVDWVLGGTGSDFEMSEDASFHWQHDAEIQDDGLLTLFDNEAAPQVGETSRGLTLALDTDAMTAEVVSELLPPEGQPISESQGNMEVLDDGTVMVGWGAAPDWTHYSADGEVLRHGTLAGGISYRAYLQDWVGAPAEPPRMVVSGGSGFVSWNGATEVAQWRFVAGPDAESAEEVALVPADTFEVTAELPDEAYVGVEALDEDGEVLATAEPGSWPLGVAER